MGRINGNIRLKGSGGSGSAVWGNIGGDIAEQADLMALLDEKQDVIDSDSKLSADLIDGLAEVATSGDYDDLTNTPDLAEVATSGDYDDLTNKPELAEVALSGDYDDLTGVPTELSDFHNDVGYITDISATVKACLLEMFQNVVYTTPNGDVLYENLRKALYNITIVGLSAVYDDTAVLYADVATLADVREHLTVSVEWSDGTETEVTGYTLSGTIAEGEQLMTVTYGDLEITFEAEFIGLSGIAATYSGGDVQSTATLDDLREDLTVEGTYTNGDTREIDNYTLSGDLSTEGTKTITVEYEGFTATFTVTVKDYLYFIDSRNIGELSLANGTTQNGTHNTVDNSGFGIMSNAYSATNTGTQYPWYYQRPNSVGRMGYPYFDIALERGKKYRYTYDCNYKDTYKILTALQFYNTTFKNGVENIQSTSQVTAHPNDFYDTTWIFTPAGTSCTDAPLEMVTPNYAKIGGTYSGSDNTSGGYIVGSRFAFKLQLNGSDVNQIPADIWFTIKIEEVE